MSGGIHRGERALSSGAPAATTVGSSAPTNFTPLTLADGFDSLSFGIWMHRGRVYGEGEFAWIGPGLEPSDSVSPVVFVAAGGIPTNMRPASDTTIRLWVNIDNSSNGARDLYRDSVVGTDGSWRLVVESGALPIVGASGAEVWFYIDSAFWDTAAAEPDDFVGEDTFNLLDGWAEVEPVTIGAHEGVVHLDGQIRWEGSAPTGTITRYGAPDFSGGLPGEYDHARYFSAWPGAWAFTTDTDPEGNGRPWLGFISDELWPSPVSLFVRNRMREAMFAAYATIGQEADEEHPVHVYQGQWPQFGLDYALPTFDSITNVGDLPGAEALGDTWVRHRADYGRVGPGHTDHYSITAHIAWDYDLDYVTKTGVYLRGGAYVTDEPRAAYYLVMAEPGPTVDEAVGLVVPRIRIYRYDDARAATPQLIGSFNGLASLAYNVFTVETFTTQTAVSGGVTRTSVVIKVFFRGGFVLVTDPVHETDGSPSDDPAILTNPSAACGTINFADLGDDYPTVYERFEVEDLRSDTEGEGIFQAFINEGETIDLHAVWRQIANPAPSSVAAGPAGTGGIHRE